jgi:hypothetical protein
MTQPISISKNAVLVEQGTAAAESLQDQASRQTFGGSAWCASTERLSPRYVLSTTKRTDATGAGSGRAFLGGGGRSPDSQCCCDPALKNLRANIYTQRKAMMKKTLLAVAVLGAFAGTAAAQSSVTLYGVADANVERIKGATSLTRISSGGVQGSRWGLRGTEDLGGGLKAVFQLESGFNIDTGTSGQGGALFGRQAYVGLAGSFGAVRLGRQYSPMDDVAGMVGTKTHDVLSVVPIIGNGDYNRVNNAVTYLTPNFGGFTAQVQYSLGAENQNTNTSKDFQKQYSMHAMYSGGPFSAGLSVMRVI